MKFPATFTRTKTVPATTIGTDALLVDDGGNPRKAGKADDNTLSATKVSINGWPISRLVLAAKYTGAGVATKLPVSMFVFEDSLGMWLPLAGSDTGITPGKVTAPTAPIFFDVFALNDLPALSSNTQSAESGNCTFLCIVSDNASPDGRYDFSMAAELTTKPF